MLWNLRARTAISDRARPSRRRPEHDRGVGREPGHSHSLWLLHRAGLCSLKVLRGAFKLRFTMIIPERHLDYNQGRRRGDLQDATLAVMGRLGG